MDASWKRVPAPQHPEKLEVGKYGSVKLQHVHRQTAPSRVAGVFQFSEEFDKYFYLENRSDVLLFSPQTCTINSTQLGNFRSSKKGKLARLLESSTSHFIAQLSYENPLFLHRSQIILF